MKRSGWTLAALVIALMVAGCNTGSYPLDVFPEMHYQPAHRPLEPERFAPPAEAVPVSGAAPRLSFQQSTELRSPLAAGPESLDAGQRLYQVNCASCHGVAGDGNGPVAAYYVGNPVAVVPPTDLRSGRVRARSDGQLWWIIRQGLGNMPPFGELLSDQETWLVVQAIREFQAR